MLEPHNRGVHPLKNVYKVVNFKRELWIRTSGSPEKHLLREEYSWLMTQDFGKNSQACKRYLHACMEEVYGKEEIASSDQKHALK
jgi:hypothetical protein